MKLVRLLPFVFGLVFSTSAYAQCNQGVSCISMLVGRKDGLPLRFFRAESKITSCKEAQHTAATESLQICKEYLGTLPYEDQLTCTIKLDHCEKI